ncbi:MAG: class I SAM-dependent methyltransferase [Candidatus Latescibacterota bacterium]|jgi:ubiquinone/menaquinone biosynthesis C-methylase UbiE
MKRHGEVMKNFWDKKARENATYYVSSYQEYDDQDLEEFWKWGDKLAERFLGESGIAFTGSEKMLEIGCGVGRMTRYFARGFKEVHGIDVSEEMIKRARENLVDSENVQLHVGNGCDLGLFEDGAFDFVFSYITFQHIPDVSVTLNYIREAGRVLRNGGHFYFQVNNVHPGIRSRLRLRSRIGSLVTRYKSKGQPTVPATEGPKDLDHPAWCGSAVSAKQLRRACASASLEIVDLNGEGTQYLWVKAVKR